MLSSTHAAPDPEAQRPPAPSGRSCRPLPWALNVALLLLSTAACTACLVRAWAAPGAPASPVPGSVPSPRLPEDLELTPGARARLPNSPQGVFAQLVVPDGVQLTEGPVQWYSEPGMAGVTLAPGVSYDKHTHELVVAEAGVYYVFLHLALKRVMPRNSNSSGLVSANLHLHPSQAGAATLALTLDLSSSHSGNSVAGFRNGLLHLDARQRLSLHLHSEVRDPRAWKLSAEATVLGLFRVATPVPTGQPLPQLT
ncbi:tumor necrosis factor ligand superfamily member 9 [Hippopotamus amphibius kiboko]|uniref:tumor necrosis factor ligand superfamily member 9 n=1 Tax=Hippopotamus amphibius kiboko TaxID=575201 RepID=UPI002591F092|nr:tumor necrosis factor ligand superfamily member 9 [Hippopotamus amphibius kiboko]